MKTIVAWDTKYGEPIAEIRTHHVKARARKGHLEIFWLRRGAMGAVEDFRGPLTQAQGFIGDVMRADLNPGRVIFIPEEEIPRR